MLPPGYERLPGAPGLSLGYGGLLGTLGTFGICGNCDPPPGPLPWLPPLNPSKPIPPPPPPPPGALGPPGPPWNVPMLSNSLESIDGMPSLCKIEQIHRVKVLSTCHDLSTMLRAAQGILLKGHVTNKGFYGDLPKYKQHIEAYAT